MTYDDIIWTYSYGDSSSRHHSYPEGVWEGRDSEADRGAEGQRDSWKKKIYQASGSRGHCPLREDETV